MGIGQKLVGIGQTKLVGIGQKLVGIGQSSSGYRVALALGFWPKGSGSRVLVIGFWL